MAADNGHEEKRDMELDPSKLVPEKVSRAVYDGLEQIRRTGQVDMADRAMVWSAAMEMELKNTARWLQGISTHLYEVLTRKEYIILDDNYELTDYSETEPVRS